MFETVIYPLMAAQLYFIFLLYFVAVRKHISRYYLYYIFFLIGLIYYLGCKPLQHHSPWALQVHYTRTLVLFVVGAPSLVVAALLQCGYQIRRRYIIGIYLLGAAFGMMYTGLYDISRGADGFLYHIGISREVLLDYIPQNYLKHPWPQSVGSVVMFLIPSAFLLWKEYRSSHRAESLVFVLGTFVFTLCFSIGSITHEYWIYYFGSFSSAPFWGWAILHDIRGMKDKADRFIAMIPGQIEEDSAGQLDQTVVVVKEFIEQNYTRDLGVDDISDAAGISRSHCMKLFKEQTGLTVNQYLTEVRICSSKRLLLSKSVTDTAFAVGYNDSNYFSKVFKKHTGLSPVQYQQSTEL